MVVDGSSGNGGLAFAVSFTCEFSFAMVIIHSSFCGSIGAV